MLGNILPPYHSLQELNLDWILTKVKNILRFVPDDGAVGQILRRTAHGAEWSDEQTPTVPVQSVNGQTGDVVLDAADVGALPAGTDVSKVEQFAATPSSYTYWRPLLVGASSNASEGFNPSTVTDKTYAFKTIECQPSTGTISAKFKGDLTGTASGNYVLPAGGIPGSDLADKYAGSAQAGGAAELTCAIPYGEIASGSSSTVMTATVPGVHELKDGVCCYIRNDIVTSASGFTLNINGLGAKPVYQSSTDATRVSTGFSATNTYLFIYNEKRVTGGCWDMYQGTVSSNTIGYQLRTNSTRMTMTDSCYRYRLLFSGVHPGALVPANSSTSTNATAIRTTNQRPINPFGGIWYYGSTTVVNANSLPSAASLWQQYVVTLGYSFNNVGAALSLTAYRAVYLRCQPQSDGSAVMEYFTQTLPSTDDSKIYIYLGTAIDATTMELQMCHPVYYYKNGSLRLWTNAASSGGISFDDVYPIGSIYMSANSTDPGTLFGGTWQQLQDRFLLGAGSTYTAGSTGGETDHTLTTAEMPTHSHGVKLTSQAVQTGTSYARLSSTGSFTSGLISDEGSGQAHNNMPPYLVVYMWQRTA